MKRQLIIGQRKSYLVRSILLTGILIISMIPVVSAQAQLNSPEVEIKYAGSLKGKPVFQVEYNNESKNPIGLSITDEDGRLFFSEKLNQQFYSKRFQVDADENYKLILTVIDTKQRKRQVYLINGKVDATADFGVTKL
jgi:hypothetical protein